MNSMEEKLGYLIAKAEEQGKDFQELKTRFDALEKRVEDKFKTAEATFRVFKFIGAAALLILTFKLGDLPTLWHSFFG